MGAWRSLAVWKEKQLIKLPQDILSMEYAAMMREMCVAYRLLEDFGNLKPGDAVVLNAATSTVGQCVVQLCAMLKCRAPSPSFGRPKRFRQDVGLVEIVGRVGSVKG